MCEASQVRSEIFIRGSRASSLSLSPFQEAALKFPPIPQSVITSSGGRDLSRRNAVGQEVRMAANISRVEDILSLNDINREFPADRNRNRQFFIQLIQRRYLIHFDKFYLTNMPKNLLCVIIINLK